MNTKKKIKIKTFFKTTSLKDFASSKDKVPLLSKSNVVYEVCCPGCGENYIGKTERTVRERSIEHAWSDTESPMRNHLRSCPHFNHLYDILTIFEESSAEEESMKRRNFTIQSLQEHIKIIDNDRSWNHLLYKEALNIERKDPGLNKGLKASRQLKLFRWRPIFYLTSNTHTWNHLSVICICRIQQLIFVTVSIVREHEISQDRNIGTQFVLLENLSWKWTYSD